MTSETHQDGQQAASPAGVAAVPTVDAAAVLAMHHPFRGAMAGVAVNCRECGTPWRGDAETGGCEAVLLARRVALLEGLLRAVCDAVIDVAYWRSKHNGRRQRHSVVVLEDTVRAAMAALAGGG